MISEKELKKNLNENLSMRAIARKKGMCHVKFHRYIKANFQIEKIFRVKSIK